MREFICGYQTLLTCAGELTGFALFVLLMLGLAMITFDNWLTERKKRKRTPHPKTCWTVARCCGQAACWNVPSCASRDENRESGGTNQGGKHGT